MAVRSGGASGLRSVMAFFGLGWTARPLERVALSVDVDLLTTPPAVDIKTVYHVNYNHREEAKPSMLVIAKVGLVCIFKGCVGYFRSRRVRIYENDGKVAGCARRVVHPDS